MPDLVALAADPVQRRRIVVRGVVQGVGFRPFVARLAAELDLTGHCGNDEASVFIEAEGPPASLAELVRRIRADAPPMALVEEVRDQALVPRRRHRLHDRAQPGARGCADPGLAGRGHLPRLPRRAGRPRRPPVPAPVHHLHQLRPPVHDHPATSPTTGRPRRWRASRCARRAGRSTPTRPIVATTPSRSPATTAVPGCGSRRTDAPRSGTDDDVLAAGAGGCCGTARSSRSRGSAASTSPATPPTQRPSRRCASASTGRASRSRSWPATWMPCAPSRPCRRPRRRR